MSYSLPERIAQRVTMLLMGQTAAGDALWRDRQEALTHEEPVAILIELAEEETETLGSAGPFGRGMGVERNTVGLLVTVCVRSSSWQTVADGVRVAAHALIASDIELNRIGPVRRKRCEWRPAGAEIPFGYVSQLYLIPTLALSGDVTVQAQ